MREKNQAITGRFHHWHESAHHLTRERAAYLLRAARSRSRGNVRHGTGSNRWHSYHIQDANYTIEKQAPPGPAVLPPPFLGNEHLRNRIAYYFPSNGQWIVTKGTGAHLLKTFPIRQAREVETYVSDYNKRVAEEWRAEHPETTPA